MNRLIARLFAAVLPSHALALPGGTAALDLPAVPQPGAAGHRPASSASASTPSLLPGATSPVPRIAASDPLWAWQGIDGLDAPLAYSR